MSLTSVSLLACRTPGKKSNFVATSGSPLATTVLLSPSGQHSCGAQSREHCLRAGRIRKGAFLLRPGSVPPQSPPEEWHRSHWIHPLASSPCHSCHSSKAPNAAFCRYQGVVPCQGVQSRLRGEAMTHGRRKGSVDDGLATGQGDAMAHGKRISMSSSSPWQDRERPGRFCVPALHGELTHLPVTSPNLLLLQAQGS